MFDEIESGGEVRIPCTATQGAFEDERLITIDTIKGPIAGFIDADHVKVAENGDTYVCGVVHEVDKDRFVIKLRGSFFTTTELRIFLVNSLS